MLRSCDGLRLHYAEKDAIIFFCAALLRQLPLCSLLCHSLCESCRLGFIFRKNGLIFSKTLSVVYSASSVRCLRMQKAAQLGSSSCASLALRLHVATAIPSDCSEN